MEKRPVVAAAAAAAAAVGASAGGRVSEVSLVESAYLPLDGGKEIKSSLVRKKATPQFLETLNIQGDVRLLLDVNQAPGPVALLD